MTLIERYIQEEIITGIVIIVYFILKYSIAKLVRKYATVSETLEHRSNLVLKYINILLAAIAIIVLFIIWGVKAEHLFVTLSSVFAVLGVALFAQWSILTNITSGIILFFSFPFKIGDVIVIHDKDFPVEAEIEDIRSFYTYLRVNENETVVFPNSLLLQKGTSILFKKGSKSVFTNGN